MEREESLHHQGQVPLPISRFIGREREREEVAALVIANRLVTLTGTGGVGKTRLAYEAGRRLQHEFSDGVVAVSLEALESGERVAHAVAEALDIPYRSDQPLLDSIADSLAGREMLLLFDNCEHLVDACSRLIEAILSRCCLDLRIMTTSREPLHVAGELVWPVPPLAQPPAAAPLPGLRELESFDAVQLFVERARSVQPGFALTPVNAGAVVEICRQLDGLPLAIELAATRVRVLTPAQIAARLAENLDLLARGPRTAPRRQQTMRETIHGSFRLLDEAEKKMLARLSVFRGGWTVEAGEALAAGLATEGRNALELLASLLDKSLVVAEPREGEMRYRLLDTIRRFAAERLAEEDEEQFARERHLAYFVEFAESGNAALHKPDHMPWLARLDAETDNFDAALSFALEGNRGSDPMIDQGLRLGHALTRAWNMWGRHAVGCGWLRRATEAGRPRRSVLLAQALLDLAMLTAVLTASPPAEPIEESLAILEEASAAHSQTPGSRVPEACPSVERTLRATALLMKGVAAWAAGDNAAARVAVEESLALFSECGDEPGAAEARWQLGITEIGMDAGLALQLATDRLAAYEKLGDEFGAAQPRFQLAHLCMVLGDYGTGRRLYEQCLEGAKRYRNRFALIASLLALGRLDRFAGDLESAARRNEAALLLAQESRLLITNASEGMGFVLLEQGKHQLALAYFCAGLENHVATGDPMNVSSCLIGIAHSKVERRQAREAARLLGAVEAIYGHTGPGQYWYDRPDLERATAAVRARLAESEYQAALAAGRGLSMDEAVRQVLGREELEAPALAALTRLQAEKARFDGLTARERQIASLIAEGMSNREIGEQLIVSERTVDSHLANIFSKLGFTSRAQVAAWAVQKGLRIPQQR